MTVSIRQILATLPSGEAGVPLSIEELGNYLEEHCNTEAEKARNKRHLERDDFYRDGGAKVIEDEIDRVFEDDDVRRLRKAMIPLARFNNVVKRIVRELAVMYAAPAKRTVAGAVDQERYKALLEETQFDVLAQEINRLAELHYAILVGPRVRVLPDGRRDVVIDIATPATARAVLHPNDATIVVGWLTRTSFRTKRGAFSREPVWVLWTDHEYGFLDERLHVIGDLVEHGLGVNRWVPLTLAPGCAGFWPGEAGEDLISAQKAIALIGVLLVKETKSTQTQTMLTGDTANMSKGQAAEGERALVAPEGVNAQTVQWGTDPEKFINPSDHVLERVGNNYGLSMAQLTHQGVQSADARDLMRVPIKELRRERLPIYRAFERRFVVVFSIVVSHDDPERAFSADGFRCNFAEAQTPLSPNERHDLFLKRRKALLTNTVDELRDEDPDLEDDKAAEAKLVRNVEIETTRVGLMKELMAMGGGTADGGDEETDDGEPADEAEDAETDSTEDQAA